MTSDGQPETGPDRRVTANGRVYPASAHAGRVFTEADDSWNAGVAVIGYGLWQRHLGGDAIGREQMVNDQIYSVIGIMPRGFVRPTRVRSEPLATETSVSAAEVEPIQTRARFSSPPDAPDNSREPRRQLP